jgi:hypothetical protein
VTDGSAPSNRKSETEVTMVARQAIATAKNWIAEVHADEDLRHLSLEEIRKSDDT